MDGEDILENIYTFFEGWSVGKRRKIVYGNDK